MGEVYKAKDTRLDRTVAIKVLPSHLSDNPELKQRLEREARAISSLNHPHICILYDIQDGVQLPGHGVSRGRDPKNHSRHRSTSSSTGPRSSSSEFGR